MLTFKISSKKLQSFNEFKIIMKPKYVNFRCKTCKQFPEFENIISNRLKYLHCVRTAAYNIL